MGATHATIINVYKTFVGTYFKIFRINRIVLKYLQINFTHRLTFYSICFQKIFLIKDPGLKGTKYQ